MEAICKCEDYVIVDVIIAGDFNLPRVSWETGLVKASLDSINIENKFLNMFCETGLSWHINEITRSRYVNGELQESQLDQILCTNDSMIDNIVKVSKIGKSDHF